MFKGLVGDSSQRPRTSRGGTAMISTTMPLTSAYSQHQNISDEMNIYVHQETKSINGNTSHLKIINSYFVIITGYKLIFFY